MIDCIHYDEEFDCCTWFSSWGQDMPILQPCIESPCSHYIKKKKACEFCKDGEEKCGTCERFFMGMDGCATNCDSEKCIAYKPVNHCYMCGRKLKKENENEQKSTGEV